MKKLLGCFLCVMLLLFGVSSVGATVLDLTGTGSDIYNFQSAGDGSLWRVIQSQPNGVDPGGLGRDWTANGGFEEVRTTGIAPEPATILLLGSGLIGLAGLVRKKFKK